jgi:hypothetical protein
MLAGELLTLWGAIKIAQGLAGVATIIQTLASVLGKGAVAGGVGMATAAAGLPAIGAGIGGFFSALGSAVANPAGGIGLLVVTGIILEFVAVIQALANTFKNVEPELTRFVKLALTPLIETIMQNLPSVGKMISDIIEAFGELQIAIGEAIVITLKGVGEAFLIFGEASVKYPLLGAWLVAIAGGLAALGVGEGIQGLGALVSGGSLKGLAENMGDMGKALATFKDLPKQLKEFSVALAYLGGGEVLGAIGSAIADFFSGGSTASKLAEGIEDIGNAVKNPLNTNLNTAIRLLGNLGDSIKDTLGDIETLLDEIEDMRDVSSTAAGEVKGALSELAPAAVLASNDIMAALNALPSRLGSIGTNITGVFKTAFTSVRSLAVSAANDIYTGFQRLPSLFSQLGNNIRANLATAFSGVGESAVYVANTIYNAFSQMPSWFYSVAQGISRSFSGAFNNLAATIKNSLNVAIQPMNEMIKQVNRVGQIMGKFNRNGWSNVPYINYLARGGTPSVGSLFVAGENGAELIGDYQNKTTVMPLENSSFVEAMAEAVYNSMMQAYSQQPQTAGAGNVYLDATVVGQVLNDNARYNGVGVRVSR